MYQLWKDEHGCVFEPVRKSLAAAPGPPTFPRSSFNRCANMDVHTAVESPLQSRTRVLNTRTLSTSPLLACCPTLFHPIPTFLRLLWSHPTVTSFRRSRWPPDSRRLPH